MKSNQTYNPTYEELCARPLPTAAEVSARLEKACTDPSAYNEERVRRAFIEHFVLLGVKPLPLRFVKSFEEGYKIVEAAKTDDGEEQTGRPIPTDEKEKARYFCRLWLPFVDCYESGIWMFWVLPTEVIIVPRPIIHEDAQERIHCADGPAAYWPGTDDKKYVWHGVEVTEQIIMRPETLTPKQILGEQNAEVRRVMMERYGLGKLLKEAQAKVVDSGVQPMLDKANRAEAINELLELDLPGDPEGKLTMVRVIDPSTGREYFLRVHPELRPMLAGNKLGEPQKPTVLNAVASTFGMRGDEYKLVAET